jgi:glutathione S-transferase
MSDDQTLALWQTEWCPASHRVRQRLTELGLTYVTHQVPVDPGERNELEAATGQRTIPALVVASGSILRDEAAILDYLDTYYDEPPGAVSQRQKAEKAKRKELEAACPKLAAATH